ncbi:MAG: ATP-binding protein [Thermoleophilia bacterium]
MRLDKLKWLDSKIHAFRCAQISGRTSHPLTLISQFIGFALLLLLFVSLLEPYSVNAKSGAIRVGIYQNSPKVFTNEDGDPDGIFVDIIDEIARKENWTIDYVEGTWSENLNRLENNEIDLLVDMSYSLERAEKFTLSNTPVLESWLDVYAKREVHIGSIHDLENKKIAVLEDSIQEKYLREEIKPAYKIDFTMLPYSDYPDCVEAVKSGDVDLMVATRFFSFSPTRDEEIQPANVIFRPENLHFAYPKDSDPELVTTIDRHVASMKNDPDSVYYQSLHRWMNFQMRTQIPDYIKYALAFILALAATIGGFAMLLRRQVTVKTRELRLSNDELKANNIELDLLNIAQVEANKALHESDVLLKETQALAGLGGWEYDVETGRLKWTDEVYHIYGVDYDYDPNDLDRDFSFYEPDDALLLENAFRQAVEVGEPYDLELELVRADGEHLWVRTLSKPVIEDGKVTRVTGNIIDITGSKQAKEEKQRLQDQLLLAKKMEIVGRLAGGVAHDFNNMLTVILGYTELALGKVDLGQSLRSDLQEVQNAAKHSMDITRQLLAFARKQSIAPRVLDLNEAVGGVLTMLQRLIGEDIDLAWLPGENLWPVTMDPAQVDQILANLCINARDAIDGVGKVTIETENVVFDEAYCSDNLGFIPGEYVLLAISDDGYGISRETMDKIFEPFFTTKEVGHGTGLGLATVFGIVQQNKGLIKVYSEPDKGTTFKIFLPKHDKKAGEVQVANEVGIPQGHGETILLVEDEEAILQLTWRILNELGYKLLISDSPLEAIRLAREHDSDIHLLITDVVMPDINGKELADRLRKTRPSVKCLFMSGYTADVIAHRGVLDEGVEFIQKPFSRKDLAIKVREALESK